MIGNISIWQLLILLAIVVLLFGTSRLPRIGHDFAAMMKSFRGAFGGKDGGVLREAAQTARELNEFKDGVNQDVREAVAVAAGKKSYEDVPESTQTNTTDPAEEPGT